MFSVILTVPKNGLLSSWVIQTT